MKDYNEEYFLVSGSGSNFPLLEFDGPMSIQNKFKFFKREMIDDTSTIPLRFGEPLPRKPKMADVHNLRANIVISERLKLLLDGFNLKNVQFVPTTIRGKSDVYDNYFIIHVYNMLRCADMEKSEYVDRNKEDAVKRIYDFNRLVLDNEALAQIPLEERLIIYVEEGSLCRVYHSSLVKKILEMKPTGVAFYQLSTYNPRKPFEAEFIDWILNDDED